MAQNTMDGYESCPRTGKTIPVLSQLCVYVVSKGHVWPSSSLREKVLCHEKMALTDVNAVNIIC